MSEIANQLAAIDHNLIIQANGAVTHRDVDVTAGLTPGNVIGTSGVHEIAGKHSKLAAVEITPVVDWHRIPARQRIHSPANM